MKREPEEQAEISQDTMLALVPVLDGMARKVCFHMAEDLSQEAATALLEYLEEHRTVTLGYALKLCFRAMRDYYIANVTPVYIPSSSLRNNRTAEMAKQLLNAWMGARRD